MSGKEIEKVAEKVIENVTESLSQTLREERDVQLIVFQKVV